MSGLQLSASTRALLEAARSDAPAAAARAQMWTGVATTVGLAGAAGTSIAAGTTASASKLLAVGALLGSAVTVGVTLALLRVMGPHAPIGRGVGFAGGATPSRDPAALALLGGPSAGSLAQPRVALGGLQTAGVYSNPGDPPADPALRLPLAPGPAQSPGTFGDRRLLGTNAPPDPAGPARDAAGVVSLAVSGDSPPEARNGALPPRRGGSPGSPGGHAQTPGAKAGTRTTPRLAVEDPLMREAALVAEARGSLVRGDALGALRTIRAAGSVSSRALEPEELSIESRALRALGRDAEAAEVDVELRSRYPDHALSR